MASYLSIFAIPDEHISFLKNNPHQLDAYTYPEDVEFVEDKPKFRSVFAKIMGKKQNARPNNWPQSEIEMIGPEVNHRNVALFHYLLNGTSDVVKGAGSLFQTWLSVDTDLHDAINMDECHDNFAFNSTQIPELFLLLEKLDEALIVERYNAFYLLQGEDRGLFESVDDDIITGIVSFKNEVRQVVKNNLGLMWIVC